MKKTPFLIGVACITFSTLMFQTLQTRILSVIAWYYLAFFAISAAMLGMTVGAVWVYYKETEIEARSLPGILSRFALATAVTMPLSVAFQFCLITTLTPSLTSALAWSLLLAAMAVPYVCSGVVVALALTRSPFPTGQVYGVDLVGAALGCVAIILVFRIANGPNAVVLAGVMAALAAMAFAASATGDEREALASTPIWRRPVLVVAALGVLFAIDLAPSVGFRPLMVKDEVEHSARRGFERWNSYSRIRASAPQVGRPMLWGPSAKYPADFSAPFVTMNIDGQAGTTMSHYDGTPQSIAYLQYDLVYLAYRLPGIQKSAVIGVGGGRDLLAAHYFGVKDETGVELNEIFVDLLTRNPTYSNFANLKRLPDLRLHIDDARSWFASTHERFDLIQMSMIDTWASTGAGAFSLSENGLYTIEGWRAFLAALSDHGVFTVSRWYNPSNINETGRMISLATGALLEAGASRPLDHLYVASDGKMATLVLSKTPFSAQQVAILDHTVADLGFTVLLAPNHPPTSPVLVGMVTATDRDSLDRAARRSFLDLSVSTDDRPFFFNQLRFNRLPQFFLEAARGDLSGGVVKGNLVATAALALILAISIVAVAVTVLLPLRHAIRETAPRLVVVGSLYFGLIGLAFMFAEIGLIERFSIFLGHPVYALSVGLFSLILASGLGSLASSAAPLRGPIQLATWCALLVAYLVGLQHFIPVVFHAATIQPIATRILLSVALIMPLGLLMGYAFPTGMALVGAIDERPKPWFWGINGAAGVLGSVLAVFLSLGLGIGFVLLSAAACYALVAPCALVLRKMAFGEPVLPGRAGVFSGIDGEASRSTR